MAIYHLSINIISRGKGKSAVAAAAYRAAEKLTNEYDGLTHNYTNKDGVLHSEIILPEHAPSEYYDRSTLWNAVEKIEKAKNSQLAREFDVALPKELSVEQNIELFHEYCCKNFVDEGMCVDFAIHDKKEDDNENIHAHVMLTMRPLNQDGSWGIREKKDYELDEHGERIPIIDPTTGLQKVDGRNRKQWKRCYVQTNDWNNQANAEIWRESWANMCNEFLERHNHTARIDHRSYERQGVDIIPSIHMGVVACEMENNGIQTERGNINREIKEDNALMSFLKFAISTIKGRITELFSSPEIPRAEPKQESLIDILSQFGSQFKCMPNRNFGLSERLHLPKVSTAIAYVKRYNLSALNDLQSRLKACKIKHNDFAISNNEKVTRLKELDDLLSKYKTYKRYKPIYDEYKNIMNEKKRLKFYQANKDNIIIAEKLRAELPKSLKPNAWNTEQDSIYSEMSEIKTGLGKIADEISQIEIIIENVEKRNINRKEPQQEQEHYRKKDRSNGLE